MEKAYNLMKKFLIAGIIANAVMSVLVFTLVATGVLELGVK